MTKVSATIRTTAQTSLTVCERVLDPLDDDYDYDGGYFIAIIIIYERILPRRVARPALCVGDMCMDKVRRKVVLLESS